MGVPLRKLIRERGEIKAADCIGCGRCIQVCPKGALRFVDIRDYLGFRHEFPQPLKAKAKPSVEQKEEVPAAIAGDAPAGTLPPVALPVPDIPPPTPTKSPSGGEKNERV